MKNVFVVVNIRIVKIFVQVFALINYVLGKEWKTGFLMSAQRNFIV